MADREKSKLNRRQLLEALLEQTERVAELEKKVAYLESELAAKELVINNAGSIAEACMELNGVFEAAQAAADQYLLNVRRLGKSMEVAIELERERRLREFDYDHWDEMMDLVEGRSSSTRKKTRKKSGVDDEK